MMYRLFAESAITRIDVTPSYGRAPASVDTTITLPGYERFCLIPTIASLGTCESLDPISLNL